MPYCAGVHAGPVTVVESREYSLEVAAVFSSDEVEELKFYLACNPLARVVVPETGGVRKLRWAAKGKGKRGGARVIYYYHNDALPLYLFGAYSKASKRDLTAAQKHQLTKVVKEIVEDYRRQ